MQSAMSLLHMQTPSILRRKRHMLNGMARSEALAAVLPHLWLRLADAHTTDGNSDEGFRCADEGARAAAACGNGHAQVHAKVAFPAKEHAHAVMLLAVVDSRGGAPARGLSDAVMSQQSLGDISRYP